MEYVGGLSGAALGYITAGTRGAIKGGMAGYKVAQNKSMPPINKRKRTSSVSAGTVRRQRPKSNTWKITKLPVKKQVKSEGRSNPGGYRSVYGNPAAVVVSGRKVAMRKRRKMKISSSFKRKVMKALDDHLYGVYTSIQYGVIFAPNNASQQRVTDFGWFFKPIQILHSTDVLFNGATPLQDPGLSNITWKDSYIRKDWVVNTTVDLLFKNSSQRTYTCIWYECEPKAAKPTAATADTAANDWASGLVLANANGTNPQNNAMDTLFSVPEDSPQFRQFWRAKRTKFILTPGAEYTLRTQGPNQHGIDWTKLVTLPVNADLANTFVPSYQKWSRSCFLVAYPDVVITTTGIAGRFPSGVAGRGGLTWEWKSRYVMQCPASAGFVYPASTAAGQQQQLTNKKPTHVIRNFVQSFGGIVEDVLEENPLAVIDPQD